MRKMFTRLFSLTLLAFLISTVTWVSAQSDCITISEEANVVLVTDPATVCDSMDLLYAVVGFPASEYEFAFNYAGSTTGGFTNDSTVLVPEGVEFTVQVRLKDSTACSSNVLVVENASMIEPVTLLEPGVEQPQCFGDMGEVTVRLTGNHPPYTYYCVRSDVWTGPGTGYVGNSSSQFIRGAGKYYVAVQDANDCIDLTNIANWDSAVINAAPTEILVADVNGLDPSCIDGDGTVTVTAVSGGTPWIDGYDIIVNGDTIRGTTADFYVGAGTYTAKVVDSLGCVVTSDSSAVLADPDPVTFEIAIEDVTCAEGANGIIYVTDFAGGSGVQYYAKVDDGSWILAVNDTVALINLTPEYHSVYVKQETACDSVGYENPNQTGNVVSVQAPGEIEYVVEIDTVVCFGDSSTITITNVEGGQGTYQYALNGVWGSDFSWNVPAGSYTVSVRDANDTTCFVSYPEITLSDPDSIAIDTVYTVSPSCKDGNDGVINIVATAEEGHGIEYSIDGEAWYTNNIFAVPADAFTVYVRDMICPDDVETVDVVVEQLDDNVIAIAEEDTFNSCFGVNTAYVYLEATSWADQTGSDDREITYYMTTDEDELRVGGELTESSTDGEFEELAPGTYYFWADDNYGCVSENTLTVVVTEADELTMDGEVTDDATCYGDNDGVITITATGTPLKYAHANTMAALLNLSDLAYTNWPAEAESVQIQVGKGTYYVIVKDDCGEKVYDGPFVVEGLDEVTIDEETVSVTDILCYGDETGVIEISPAEGGTGVFTYTLQVDNEGWEDVEGYVDVTTTVFEELPAGTYRVVVTDEGGCEGTVTGEIVVDGPESGLTRWDWYTNDISCNGAADGNIGFWMDGGTQPYEFKIGNANWRAFPEEGYTGTGASQEIVITEPGTYTVRVRDANGCESLDGPYTYVINEPDAVTVDIDVTNVTNTCDADNGALAITPNGGHYIAYDILLDGDYIDWVEPEETLNITDLEAGSHTVKVIDWYNECVAEKTVTIFAPDTVTATAVVTAPVSCNGGENGVITVSAMSGGTVEEDYTVTLNPGNIAGEVVDGVVVFEGLEAGSYDVTVSDDLGCSFTWFDLEVEEPTALTLNATKIQDVSCTKPGMFSVQVTGGVGDYKYFAALSQLPQHILIPDPASPAWQEDSIFSVNVGGTYIVWAMDANECVIGGEENSLGQPVNAWRVKVEEPEYVVTVDADLMGEILCNGDLTDTIAVQSDDVVIKKDGVTLGNPVYTVTIDEVETDTLANIGAGTYVVIVTHESGCWGSDTITIEEPEKLEVTLNIGEGEFTCAEVTEGYIEAVVTGGTVNNMKSASAYSDYEFQLWQDGVLKTDYIDIDAFLVKIGHSYQVVVKDLNGCTDTSNVVVVNPVASVEIVAIKDVTCSSDTLASVLVTVTGEEGREFRVHYDQFENDSPSDTGVSDWFTGTIKLDQVLMFDNENVDDIHYEFWVEDDMGCVSETDTMTFDQVITSPLELVVTENTAYECSSDVTISVGGGVAPYVITVDGEPVAAGVVTLQAGTHVINTTDLHGCLVSQELVLEYEAVTSEETMTVFIGDTAHFVFESIDTMLVAGTYSFEYVTEAGCTRVVNVTVNEVPKTYTIAEVQGTEDASPLAGKVAEITGTVTAVAAGQGFFVQDAVAAWSGIWVAYPSVSTAGILVGNAVKVVGDVAEVASVTTITATSVELKTSPLAITAIEVTPTEAEAEMYESVLTMVKGVRADAADANGAWNVYLQPTDNITVNDWLYAYTPVKDTYYNVTGVVNGKDNAFKLEPRMASDVVDLTSTVVNPELENTFNVYPNPFNDHITIDNNDKLTRVVVVNVAGQRVIDIEYPNREIRTANLVSGVYVISLYTEDGIAKSERIIKR